MRSRIDYPLTLSLLVACSFFAACGADDAPAQAFHAPLEASTSGTDADWVLVFADEFDGSAIDAAKWTPFEGDPRHKSTINTTSRSLAAVRDGSMFVSAIPTPEDAAFPYATGYVDTRGLFAQTYGKIEFRARCMYAPGVWYALWGRSWKNLVPEIDLEFLAENINQAWLVNHWGVPPVPADQRRGFTTVDGLDITKFHTYTIVWKHDLIEWAIDGKPFRRVTDPAHIPQEPMFWVMNAWVGGWGGIPGPSTIFPASIEVDHLRISRLREWTTPAVIQIDQPKATYARSGAIDVELADFDALARVEVWDGDSLVETLTKPPFRFAPKALAPAAHKLTFVGTDGSRTATTVLDVVIE